MPARIVRRVRVRVPPGPAGLLGWALGAAGQRVLPWGDQQYMVMDDESITWDLEGQITSGAWQLQAYNTGLYDHTVYVTFELDMPQVRRVGGPLLPIPAAAISDGSGGSVGSGGGGGAESPDTDMGGEVPAVPPAAEEPPPPESEPGPVLPPPDPSDGYAVARANAVHALQAALGDPITVPGSLPPAPGSVAAVAYDAGRMAAIAALELI
jgi:hypothetical protein